jgi:hypothetical protein
MVTRTHQGRISIATSNNGHDPARRKGGSLGMAREASFRGQAIVVSKIAWLKLKVWQYTMVELQVGVTRKELRNSRRDFFFW